jgi:hypothetical protein
MRASSNALPQTILATEILYPLTKRLKVSDNTFMWVRLFGLFLFASSGCAACSKSPDAFASLPKQAQMIAFFDGAQLRNTKLWEAFWAKSKRDSHLDERLTTLRTFLTLDLFKDAETLSVAAWLESGMQPQFAGIVTLSAGANTKSLQAALQEQSRESKKIGGTPFFSYSSVWISLLGEGEVLFGSEQGVASALLVKQGQAASVLQNERLMSLKSQVGPGQFFLVADVPVFIGAGAAFFLPKMQVPGLEGLSNLASLSSVILAVDFYNGVQGNAKFRVATPEAAKALANQPLVQGLSAMGSLFFLRNMDDWLQSIAKDQDWILEISIPNRQASNLLVELLYFAEQPSFSPYVPSEPRFMEQEPSP